MAKPRQAGSILCLVGLGNPGPEYAQSRHNAGRLFIEWLISRWSATPSGKKSNCDLWRADVHRMSVMLASPQSFMNLSGPPVCGLIRGMDTPLDHFMVLHDEMDLPLGRVQLKFGGSAAGHHGVESVIQSFGSPDFYRLRIGVGRPDRSNARDHVLSEFSKEERPTLTAVFDSSAPGLDDWIMGFFDRASQKLNTPPPA